MGVKLKECAADVAGHVHYSWMFVCPACKSVHQCDHRWGFNGDVERPSFSGSVLVHGDSSIGRPHCHSVVTNGRIAYGADSTHAFAGQTLDLPDWDFVRPLGGAKD